MAPPKFRADYEQLKEISASFGSQAQATRHTLQTLQKWIDVLQGGDWVGTGATAFYQEMSGQVMPSLKRLAGALESAEKATHQISQTVQQAEDDVARLFRAVGGGATPQQIASALARMVEAMGTMGSSLGATNIAAAAAAGVVQGLAGASPEVRDSVMRALEEGSVDRQLSMFSSGTRDLVKQSPTLRAQVFQLEQNGYVFTTGAVAGGSYTDYDHQTIVIAQPLSDAATVSTIAHEAGHGLSTLPSSIPATPTMTRAQYVHQNVDNMMRNEGEAQFNAAQVRAELNAAGGPDIGIPGTQTARYQRVYDNFTAGKITQAQAIDRMGTLMGNEHTSTPPYQPYPTYYADSFRSDWDTNIAPTRKPQ